jgi:hypothetical protein
LIGVSGRPIRRLVIGTFVAVVAVLIAVSGLYVGSGSSKAPGIPATPAEIAAYLDSLGLAIHLSSSPQPTLPRGTVVDGRLERPVIVDGGQMGIAPPPARATPRFSVGQAAAQAHRAESGLGDYPQVGSVILGKVWIASDLMKGLSSYQGRLAWVALTSFNPGSVSYPLCAVAPLEIVVLDAATGHDVLDFAARIPSCTPATLRVTAATELLSIPWTAIGEGPNRGQPQYFDWHVRYTIPACGTVRENVSLPTPGDPKAGHQVLGMLATVPLDMPARCSPARTVTTWFGPEWDPLSRVVHEPLGVTASGL